MAHHALPYNNVFHFLAGLLSSYILSVRCLHRCCCTVIVLRTIYLMHTFQCWSRCWRHCNSRNSSSRSSNSSGSIPCTNITAAVGAASHALTSAAETEAATAAAASHALTSAAAVGAAVTATVAAVAGSKKHALALGEVDGRIGAAAAAEGAGLHGQHQ